MLSPGGKVAQVFHGPGLMGIFLNVMLYGVVIAQAHSYYTAFPKDRKWLKIYVAIMLLADTVNTGLNIAWIYNVLINQFGNLAALARSDWLFESEEAMAGMIAMMVQMFYARRIFILTRNCWVTGIVILSSAISGLCAIGTAIAIAMRPEFAGLAIVGPIGLPWLISCTVCDITIATALSVYLSRHKTGIQRTDTIVNKIIRLTVQNGLLTASFTIAHIVTYLSLTSGIHLIFNYGVVKLYTNSIMSSLNARAAWSDSLEENDLSFIDFCKPTVTNLAQCESARQTQVNINVETRRTVDVYSLPTTDEPKSGWKGDKL